MASPDSSPKRRHILSSLNLDSLKQDIRTHRTDEDGMGAQDGTKHQNRKQTRLRLKEDRSRDSSYRHGSRERRRRRRRRRSRSPTPTNAFEPPPLDPEAAFRESLFDAMADDEGAAYWQNVYGQPVHIYSNEKAGPMGELERMTDEEYAAYVRQKMWEKTHEGVLEERARRQENRRRMEQEAKDSRQLEREMLRSLLLGEERKKRRQGQIWEDYLKAWSEWTGAVETIPWPLKGGGRKEINETAVRDFLEGGLRHEGDPSGEFAQKLKEERIRWHPDKMQQRLGGEVDVEVMKDITAVFQIIDQLWNDTRQRV